MLLLRGFRHALEIPRIERRYSFGKAVFLGLFLLVRVRKLLTEEEEGKLSAALYRLGLMR